MDLKEHYRLVAEEAHRLIKSDKLDSDVAYARAVDNVHKRFGEAPALSDTEKAVLLAMHQVQEGNGNKALENGQIRLKMEHNGVALERSNIYRTLEKLAGKKLVIRVSTRKWLAVGEPPDSVLSSAPSAQPAPPFRLLVASDAAETKLTSAPAA